LWLGVGKAARYLSFALTGFWASLAAGVKGKDEHAEQPSWHGLCLTHTRGLVLAVECQAFKFSRQMKSDFGERRESKPLQDPRGAKVRRRILQGSQSLLSLSAAALEKAQLSVSFARALARQWTALCGQSP
jgi:hypothetical protein